MKKVIEEGGKTKVGQEEMGKENEKNRKEKKMEEQEEGI